MQRRSFLIAVTGAVAHPLLAVSQATVVTPAADFLEWHDVPDEVIKQKLRALGISESFLSVDHVMKVCLFPS